MYEERGSEQGRRGARLLLERRGYDPGLVDDALVVGRNGWSVHIPMEALDVEQVRRMEKYDDLWTIYIYPSLPHEKRYAERSEKTVTAHEDDGLYRLDRTGRKTFFEVEEHGIQFVDEGRREYKHWYPWYKVEHVSISLVPSDLTHDLPSSGDVSNAVVNLRKEPCPNCDGYAEDHVMRNGETRCRVDDAVVSVRKPYDFIFSKDFDEDRVVLE